MKIKNLIALVGLFVLATSATISVKTKNTDDPIIQDVSKESFVEFLSHFEKKDLPFSIGLENMEAYDDFKKNKVSTVKVAKKFQRRSPISNSTFIPEARMGRMSRMGPPELIPVARFYPNENMIAVIYSSNLQFGSGLDKSYKLVVYDMKGNPLPKMAKEMVGPKSFLVAQSSVEQSITCHIDKEGRIWKNTYDIMWKTSLDDQWITENEITGFEIKNTEVFEMNDKGAFRQLKEVPTVVKASLN